VVIAGKQPKLTNHFFIQALEILVSEAALSKPGADPASHSFYFGAAALGVAGRGLGA